MPRVLSARVFALVCALPLALMACGSADDAAAPASPVSSTSSDATDASATPSDSESATNSPGSDTAALPDVSGDFGEPPQITVPDAEPPSELQVETLSKGDGAKVTSGQTIVVNYAGVRWEDGETFDSSFDGGGPAGFAIGVGAVIKGWDQGLVGQTVGSRVLLVIPPDLAYGDQAQGPIQAGDTLVFVVDILGAHSGTETARGELTPTEDDALPAVTVLPKKPEIFVPPGNPPPNLVAVPVVTGSGPKVQSGDTVVVQYLGVTWSKGKEFDSSWSRSEPFVTPIGDGQVIAGWDQGLVGQTVGSRVLLVIPPKLGYGSQGSGSIKPGETLVFAVDILGTY